MFRMDEAEYVTNALLQKSQPQDLITMATGSDVFKMAEEKCIKNGAISSDNT